MTDQTGTWEPDQFQMELMLQRRYALNHGDSYRIARAVIAEYRRQQAAQGKVEVDREDLLTAQAALRSEPKLAEEALEHFDAILDAATDKQ
jgi:hypothetical protein